MWPFRRRQPVAPVVAVAIEAKPVDVSPTPSARQLRNRARVARLEEAVRRGDTRRAVAIELNDLKGKI
jgi:hypothetical protein